MRTTTAILYFILAIVVFGSIGVTIPYVFEAIKGKEHNTMDLNQNVVTYFIAIFASSCLDLLIKLIDRDRSDRKMKVLFLVLSAVLAFIGTSFLLYFNANGSDDKIGFWLIFGITVSYGMWWIGHYKDDTFSPTSTLGGNPNKALKNG